MLFRVRDTEACEPQSNLLWDSVWVNMADRFGGYADWIMADANDPKDQRGGLRARMQLHTAIMLCLFTDKRLPEGMTPPDDPRDRRGWWGNSIRLPGEPEGVELGSLLWTLERGTLSEATRALAIDYATEALQVLIDQGAVARFEIDATVDPVRGMLGMTVNAFNNVGERFTKVAFDAIWQQHLTPAQSTFSR